MREQATMKEVTRMRLVKLPGQPEKRIATTAKEISMQLRDARIKRLQARQAGRL